MKRDGDAVALAGTWRLLSFHLESSDGETTYPYGPDAAGYILISDSGYMAVAFMAGHRGRFASADLRGGSIDEKAAAADSYTGYIGKWEVQGDRLVVHPEVSFFPNWVGVDQVRTWTFEGNRLTLSTPPLLIGGLQQVAYLVWERV